MRYELTCHSETPASGIDAISVWIRTTEEWPDERSVEFCVRHRGTLALPTECEPMRTDGLWNTTCFEVFLATEAGPYVEFNLSPSFQWAAYAFDGYRSGMRNAELTFDPEITIGTPPDWLFIDADLDISAFNGQFLMVGLSAVIEELDGTKSYWALAHAPGPPDFHNRDCFIATLPAPNAP